jgi:hypothetical protein
MIGCRPLLCEFKLFGGVLKFGGLRAFRIINARLRRRRGDFLRIIHQRTQGLICPFDQGCRGFAMNVMEINEPYFFNVIKVR